MKPNGRHFAARVVFLTLSTLSLLSTLATAQTMRGNFTLKATTHWGNLLLTPGAYEFTMDRDASGTLVTVRSKESGWSGMAMAESTSDAEPKQGMKLVVERSGSELYVKALCLGDDGMTLNYATPKSAKVTRLTRAQPNTTIASVANAE